MVLPGTVVGTVRVGVRGRGGIVVVSAWSCAVVVTPPGGVGAGAPPRHAESVFNSELQVVSAMHVLISSKQLALRQVMHAVDVSLGPQLSPPHVFSLSSGFVAPPVFGFTHGVVVVVVEVVGGGSGISFPFWSLNLMQLL